MRQLAEGVRPALLLYRSLASAAICNRSGPDKMLRVCAACCLLSCKSHSLMQLVYEKERRLRMMMKMHGLGDTAYWCVGVVDVINLLWLLCVGSRPAALTHLEGGGSRVADFCSLAVHGSNLLLLLSLPRPHRLVMYSWFLLLYVAYMAIFVFFGSVIGLNMFRKNSYGEGVGGGVDTVEGCSWALYIKSISTHTGCGRCFSCLEKLLPKVTPY